MEGGQAGTFASGINLHVILAGETLGSIIAGGTVGVDIGAGHAVLGDCILVHGRGALDALVVELYAAVVAHAFLVLQHLVLLTRWGSCW